MSILLALWLCLLHGGQEPVRLAIQPLTPRSVDKDDAEMVADVLAAKLMESGKFRVMERSEMSRILSEQGFQKSGACEGQKCAVEVGRILGIEQMVVGAFGKLGDSWVLTVRRVDVETGEVVGQSIRQFEGPLKDVPRDLVAVVASDLVGGETMPVASKVAPPRSIAVPEQSSRVRVRFRADSGATATWIWLEDGTTKSKLGEVPLDTVIEIRQRVFLSAAEPGIGNRAWRYWLVGPTDQGDTAWKRIAASSTGRGASPGDVASPSSAGTAAALGEADWGLYGQERRDADSRRSGGVLLKGIGWTMFATGIVVGAVSLAMANDTDSRGEYTRDQESRQSLGRTAGLSLVGSVVGVVVAIIGSNIVAEADKTLASELRIEPVGNLGIAGDARGARISLAF